MATGTPIEQRLTAVEAAVSELQRRLAHLPSTENWLEQIVGSFKDEPAFVDVLEYGRAIRSSERLLNDPNEQA